MINDDETTDNKLDIPPSHFAAQKVLVVQPSSVENLRQLTFQCMQDGFSIVDASGVHVDVNPAFCAMTGFSESELIGRGPEHSYWPPEEHENIQVLLAKALRGEFAEIELTFMRKGGERFPVLLNPFAIRDSNGTITFYATTVKDITQSVQMQSALRDSEQRYRGLFENAADAIVILQGEKIIDFNQRALEMFGATSLEQLASRASFDFFPTLQPNGQDSRKFSIEKFKAAQAGKSHFFAWHHVKLDGTPFDAEVSLSTFKLGESTFIQAIIRDITQRKQMEDELTESEQRFRALFDNAGEAIVILKDDQVIDCNERALQLTGRSRDEMLTTTTIDYFPPTQPNGKNSHEFFVEQVEASRLGIPQVFEWSGQISDGTTRSTEVTLTTFMLNKTQYTQSIIRDTTERKQLEVALRLSERRYRDLFENAGDGILLVQNSQVIDCNDRTLELYGIARDQVGILSTYELSPPMQPNGQSSKEFFVERIAALRSQNPQIFRWSGIRLDGTPIETEITMTSFMVDKELCIQSIIRDITQRNQLEAALSDSEMRFRTLFENAGDAISINKGSRTIDCNKRLPEMYGLSRDEILSATLGEFFPPTQPNGQDSRQFFEEMVNASRSGNPQVYEWHGRKRDGTPIITEINLTSLILGGETYEQAIARDITQRKQMEEALLDLNKTLEDRVLQRTEELAKTNAELLHRNAQFRALAAQLTQTENEERKRIAQFLHDNQQQLLVAAKFRSEMLQSDSYDSDVNAAGRELVEILGQALEVSRSLTMELAPPILYGAGLVVALRWLARWMQEHHQLEVDVVGTLPVTPIPTDVSILLFQAVRELLLNVIKHAGVKKACVTVALADQHFLVIVTDEGAGFDVASALDSPRSFGLFGIQERLSLLDGRLEILSVPGHGTTSTLSVPVAIAENSLSGIEIVPTPNGITTGTVYTGQERRGLIRILVADDHAGARHGLVLVLEQVEGFAIVGQAVDGLEAVEKTRVLQPDVVLMDMTMPRLNGLEATRRITTEFPGIRVIGLSMHPKEEVQPQMREAGAISYLQKSTPVDELIAEIRRVMKRDVVRAP